MTRPDQPPGLVRGYVLTGGRTRPSRNTLDLVTLVMPAPGDRDTTGLTPEQQRVVELCRPGALALAEVAAHLGLATALVKVIVADLTDSGHVTTRAPIPKAAHTDRALLERLLDGLRNSL